MKHMKNKRKKGRVKNFEQSALSQETGQSREERRHADRPKKRRKYNRGRLVLTAVVVIMIAVVGVSVKSIFSLRAEQAELSADNSRLTAEKASLAEELKNVNDYEYIEEQARIQLRLIKPGEVLYILDEQQDDNEAD